MDEMGGTRGSGNKECIAQGLGNTTCGLFGAMPGCAMIGQSIINFTSGGLTRLSGTTAAILVMVFVVSISAIISKIAVAALVGIMFMVSINTFEWASVSRLKRMKKTDAFVLVAVSVITIFSDLATQFSNEIFTIADDPKNVILDFTASRVMDSSGTEAIDKVTKLYLEAGKSLRLRHLSPDCIAALHNAGPYCIHELDDPTYKVARDV